MASPAVWKGEYYAQHSALQEGWQRAFSSYIKLEPRNRVLDLGCGDGRFTAEYALQVPHGKVVGLDSSSSMIQWARDHYAHSRLKFEQGEIGALAYDGAFDWVVSTNALHWVPDHRRVLHLIRQALKPQGQCALLFCSALENPTRMECAVNETIKAPLWRGYFFDFDISSYSYPLRDYITWGYEAGFTSLKVTRIIARDTFQDFVTFVSWIKGWLLPLQRLPSGLHDTFAEEVALRYLHPIKQNLSQIVLFNQPLVLIQCSFLL